MTFKPATKTQSRLRLALIGPSGSGKSYSALNIAQHLGQRVAVIDTERGSASKYAHLFHFDVLELDTYAPERYIAAIRDAEAGGYDVLVIDSLSHAWIGRDGILELVDRAAKRSGTGNNFAGWREATPKHNALVDAMLAARLHVIATLRSKVEYAMDRNPGTGRTEVRKVGMQPVQRDGLEYEFDVIGDLDQQDNTLVIGKTRCETLHGKQFTKPGKEIADLLRTWLTDGAPLPEPVPDLNTLVARYGADTVMDAAGGRIPGDEAELRAVAAALNGMPVLP